MAPVAAELAVGSERLVKVAVVCPYALDAVGGVQAQAIQLTERLKARGHDAWLVGPEDGGAAGVRYIGSTIRIPVNRSLAPIALNPRSWRLALRAIAGADVVHIHEPFAPFVSLGVLVQGEAPKVGTFHAAPGRLITMVYQTAGPLLRRLANRLAVATAVSPVAASAVSSLIREVRIIPIGFDFDSYQLALPRHHQRVVFLGRDEPRKGLPVLLSAWERVQRQIPAAELIVLGASRAERLRNVRYLGPVDDEAKRRELAQAAILCTPNLGYESFGTVLVEGMAAGCAVVASRLPAFENVVGDSGLLFSPGNVEQLAAALLELLRDSKCSERLGREGREKARQFSWEHVIPEYLDAYRNAIG